MTDSLNDLIEALDADALWCEEIEGAAPQLAAKRKRCLAKIVKNFRDTLKKIALNQAGLASHAAQDVLRSAGLCYHFQQDYLQDTHDKTLDGFWCVECRKHGRERLEPFA